MHYMLYRLYCIGSGDSCRKGWRIRSRPRNLFAPLMLHIIHLLHDFKKESAYPSFTA